MERIIIFLLSPQTKSETVLYMIDTCGLLITLFWIADIKEVLSIYILGLTAISITVTVGVKIYNLFNSNQKNKKI